MWPAPVAQSPYFRWTVRAVSESCRTSLWSRRFTAWRSTGGPTACTRRRSMGYQLTPISTRPWLLNGLSLRLIESHYENHYGGALRRVNAITEQLESLDFHNTPGYVLNSLNREELIALNSTLLHELYFASMAFGDGRPTDILAQALTREFGSVDRWRSEFVAMAKGLAGGSGWVLLVYAPRDRRLIHQYAGDHSQTAAGGIPTPARRSRSSMLGRGPIFPASRTSWMVRSGAIPSAFMTGSGNCRNRTRSWSSALTDFTWGARRQSRYARPDSMRST